MTEYRIISIGALAANPLWDEKSPVRTGHATTTLLASGQARVLVDPSLPPQALLARLGERTKLKPAEVTHVFLTSFDPDRRRALGAFEHAAWLMHEAERDAAGASLRAMLAEAVESGDRDLIALHERALAQLGRFQAAPDTIAPHVDLFPLPGVTPGLCGLLLAQPASTVLICGDAVATQDHLSQGKVLPHCADLAQAQESFREAIEIADVVVPGRDNVAANPMRRM